MRRLNPTPGLKYFRQQLLERFEFRPEHKTTTERMKYLNEVLDAVASFDDVVLFVTADCDWTCYVMPTLKVWLTVCRRHQHWVDAVNRDLEAILKVEVNRDPFYVDPDLTKPRLGPDYWWP